MIKNIFSISKNQVTVLTTLVVIIVLAAVYFFIYIPDNEKNVQQQRFRALQNMDRNMHEKLENSTALISNLLINYSRAAAPEKENIQQYIQQYSTKNFVLTQPTLVSAKRNYVINDSTYGNYAITINDKTKQLALFVTQSSSNNKDSTAYRMAMHMSAAQFVQMLLPKNIFDEFVVFHNNKTIYETFPAGINGIDRDSLFAKKSGIGNGGMITRNVGGSDYKIFLQAVQLTPSSEWIIGGLLSNQRYQAEKNQLPAAIVLMLVTALLAIILTLPWIKLYLMGSKDRLTITDGIMTIFIAMLLVSLIFFVFFKYNLPARFGKTNDSKEQLAHAIENSFNNEVNTAIKAVYNADSLLSANYPVYNKNITHLNDTPIMLAKHNRLSTGYAPAEITATFKNLHINQCFWLDKNGVEVTNWTTDKMNAPHGNYSHREYFKGITEQKNYITAGSRPYYLDQVISWTSGTFRSVVSIPSKLQTTTGETIAAVSVNIKSLEPSLLPKGYHYAIIDKAGKVLYHSEKERNLVENLLQEFSSKLKLKSYLEARAPGYFTSSYFGKEYSIFIKPMAQLPYYLLVLSDTSFKETRDTAIFSFTLSMLLLFVSFLMLQLMLVFMASARRSFLKKQLFDTAWLGPKKSCEKEYVQSSIFNTLLILLLMASMPYSSFLGYFFILLFSVAIIPLFLNSLFAKRYHAENKNVLRFKVYALCCLTLIILFTNIVAIKLLDTTALTHLFLFEATTILLGLLLFYYQQTVLHTIKKIAGKMQVTSTYSKNFILMGLTRLVVTCGIPVVFFYSSSYNYEQNLNIRYRHLDFVSKLAPQIKTLSDVKHINQGILPAGIYIDGSWIKNIQILSQADSAAIQIPAYKKEDSNTILYLKNFRFFMNDIAVTEDQLSAVGAADSSFYFNHLLQDACRQQQGTITYYPLAIPGKILAVKSANLNYHFPLPYSKNGFHYKGMVFWMMLVLALIVFYFILHNILAKLFGLDIPDPGTWKNLDNEVLANPQINNLVFVIGLPGAGKKFHILNKIKNGEITVSGTSKLVYNEADDDRSNVCVADLINIPVSPGPFEETMWEQYTRSILNTKNKLIIVNHFEYNIQDADTNRKKLNFLEKLMLAEHSSVFILSSIHPVAFLDSVMAQLTNTRHEPIPGEDLERWHVLLGHYRIVLLPLDPENKMMASNNSNIHITGAVKKWVKNQPIQGAVVSLLHSQYTVVSDSNGQFVLQATCALPATLLITAKGFVSEEIIITEVNQQLTVLMESSFNNWKDKIRTETAYTHFLKRMQQPAIETALQLPELSRLSKTDELAYKLQITSHYFYMYIWQSLTKEEKFLLYDLAEDNLVNTYDSYNLGMLIGKGLVIRPDGTLKIFNKGFRNFILTAIGQTEAAKIKNQIKDNSTWEKLKNPLLLVVLAIMVFLLASQEESYSKAVTYIAALGAGIPGVLKLFSLFEKPANKIS